MRRMVSLLFATAGLAIAAIAPGQSRAQTTLYATGFESPSFVPGPIEGQFGWFVFSASGQTSAPVIETTVVKTGAQAVGVPGSVNGQTGPVYAPNFINPLLDLSADIFLKSSTSETAWQFATTGANDFPYAGGINVVDGTSIQAITSGFPIVGTFTRDAWHHLDVVLDYVGQTFALKLDSVTLATNLPFCCGNNPPATELGWALFNTFGNGNDSGYMDNFSIAEGGATAPILDSENGHFYEFVAARNITWTQAEAAAAGRSFHGQQGYLATVTSASEQAFIESLLSTFTFRQLDNIWLGGNDPAGNGVWFWATGLETGMQFWQGGVTRHAVNGAYTNWETLNGVQRQPDAGTLNVADRLTIEINLNPPNFPSDKNYMWNDFTDAETNTAGYLVEYSPVFAGTPGFSNCHGKSVAALAQQFGGLNAAAAALGYPRVNILQTAIRTFCRE